MKPTLFSLCLTLSGLALAAPGPDMAKLLATSGVSQVEGAGGGGLTPWATITGYGSRDSYGANVHFTAVHTQDYRLRVTGVAAGFVDRVELSLSRQTFEGSLAPLNDLRIEQDVAGIKLRLSGNLLYDQDTLLPQVAVGAMVKHNRGIDGLGAVTSVRQLGASRDRGIDYYVSATKLLLEHRLLLNATLRATRANQFGLLGFGGEGRNRHELVPEISTAFLLRHDLAAGAEYRVKPRNLPGIDREDNAWDLFLAYFPNKHLSVTVAYVNLGDITVFNDKAQEGLYLSVQAGF